MNLSRILIVMTLVAGVLDSKLLQAQTYQINWTSIEWRADSNYKTIVLKGSARDFDPNNDITKTEITARILQGGSKIQGLEKLVKWEANGSFTVEFDYFVAGQQWPDSNDDFFAAQLEWPNPWNDNPTVLDVRKAFSIKTIGNTRTIAFVEPKKPGGGN